MNITHPVEDVASSVYACIHNKDIIPDVHHPHRGQDWKGRPYMSDLTISSFPQTWGSTALGFGGMCGAAMTTATTVVVYCQKAELAAVFFAGRLAYTVDNPPLEFFDDVKRWRVPSIEKAKKYTI